MVHILCSQLDGGSTDIAVAAALGNFELVNLLESSACYWYCKG